ncbi:hypothetical protein [Filobacillus milosensis]|nr:hypothetical protein [Filobacillus milosensis]
MMWIYYRIPTTDYYLISSVVMFLGGLILNIMLSVKFHHKSEELGNGFPRGIVLKMFGWLSIGYTTVFFVMVLLTSKIIPSLYFVIFLMTGGYSWFWTLQGYIHAKNNKEKYENGDSYNPWLGRLLFLGIALSLLMGYLYLGLIE